MATTQGLWKPLATVVKAVQKAGKSYKLKVSITSAYRSKEDQAALKKSANSYPVATPGRSQHQYGLAVDLVTVPWQYHYVVVGWMQSAGLHWGGSADPVHFAVFNPYDWAALLGQAELAEKPVSNFLVPPSEVTTAASPGKLLQAVSTAIGLESQIGTSLELPTAERQIPKATYDAPTGTYRFATGGSFKPIWGYTVGFGTDAGGNWSGERPPSDWTGPVATYVK